MTASKQTQQRLCTFRSLQGERAWERNGLDYYRTEEHKHSTTLREGCYPREPRTDSNQVSRANENPSQDIQPQEGENRKKRGLEVCLGYRELDSPLFSWTLYCTSQSPTALHASSSSNKGWHQQHLLKQQNR